MLRIAADTQVYVSQRLANSRQTSRSTSSGTRVGYMVSMMEEEEDGQILAPV